MRSSPGCAPVVVSIASVNAFPLFVLFSFFYLIIGLLCSRSALFVTRLLTPEAQCDARQCLPVITAVSPSREDERRSRAAWRRRQWGGGRGVWRTRARGGQQQQQKKKKQVSSGLTVGDFTSAAHLEWSCRGSLPISRPVKLIITPLVFFFHSHAKHCRELINDTPTTWINSSKLIYFVITSYSICSANYLLLCMWESWWELSIHLPPFYPTNRRNFLPVAPQPPRRVDTTAR